MYIRSSQQRNLMEVDENFATLDSVEEIYGEPLRPRRPRRRSASNTQSSRGVDENRRVVDRVFHFKFVYRIKYEDIFRNNAFSVRVDVATRLLTRPTMIDRRTTDGGQRSILNRIRRQIHTAKTVEKEQQKYLLASRVSDVSAHVNNSIVSQLAAGVDPQDIQDLNKKRLRLIGVRDLKEGNENVPQLSGIQWKGLRSGEEVSVDFSSPFFARSRMLDMIVRQGLDPSYIALMDHRSTTPRRSVGGISRPRRPRSRNDAENSPQTRLLYAQLFDPDDQQTNIDSSARADDVDRVQVLTHTTQEYIEVPVYVSIKESKIDDTEQENASYQVRFELMSRGVVIDTNVETINIAELQQRYYIPKEAPTALASTGGSTTETRIEVRQKDPVAKAVRVYTKKVHHASTHIEDYELYGEYPLRPNGSTLYITVPTPINSAELYRFVPVGDNGTVGAEFTNVVVRPKKTFPIKSVSIHSMQDETGNSITVSQIPEDVTSISIMVRDLTIFEKDKRHVGAPIFVSDTIKAAKNIVVQDTNVQHNHVYEYTCRLHYKSGLYEDVGNDTVEFIEPSRGKVDTRITDVRVFSTDVPPNVTFSIETKVPDSDTDVTLALLRKQELIEFYRTEMQEEREEMKMLIAHNVQRVCLETGERENFGIVYDDTFNDVEMGKRNAARPLEFGKRYRYEVWPLLRLPETMITRYVKESTDELTKKPYKFKPTKFWHPLALKEGIITTPTGRRLGDGKSEMQHGVIGEITATEVSFEVTPATIMNLTAERLDLEHVAISWQVSGDAKQIDHFIIIKEVFNTRTVIGKAHSEFEDSNPQYIHKLSEDDDGQIRYIVVPVFNDYTTGQKQRTNGLVI